MTASGFAGPVDLNSITIYVDDSGGAGGVSLPASVDIGLEGFGYTNFVLVDPDPSFAPVSFTFSGLGLIGICVRREIQQWQRVGVRERSHI